MVGTTLVTITKWSNSPVEYERPTYFQLSIAYADTNYCFATLNIRKDM